MGEKSSEVFGCHRAIITVSYIRPEGQKRYSLLTGKGELTVAQQNNVDRLGNACLTRIGYWPCWLDHQREWVEKVSPRKIVEQCVAGKIKVLEWCVPEKLFFDHKSLREGPTALKETERDILAEAVEEARRGGIKIVFGIPIHGFCINDPVKRADFISYCCELVTRYDIDGVTFDGPFIHSFSPRASKNALECPHCRKRYAADSGGDFPAAEDWNDPNWKRYVRWCGRMVNAFLKEVQANIKQTRPGVNTRLNSLINTTQGWAQKGDTDTFHECVDSIFIELSVTGSTLLAPVLEIKLARALTEGRRPEAYHKTGDLLLGKAHLVYGRPSFAEAATLAYIGLASGADVGFHSSMDEYGQPHPERTAVYQEVGREIDRRAEWLVGAEPSPEVALHFSQNTRNFYGAADVATYAYTFMGAEQLLAEAHVPSSFVLDHQLDDRHLREYPLLVMANSACLADAQNEAVKSYVRNGGGLLATGETSLYDEEGNLRRDFGLAEVLGVNRDGVHPKVKEAQQNQHLRKYPFYLRPHAITEDLQKVARTLLPWFGMQVRDGREVLGTWCDVRQNTGWACVNAGLEIIGDSGMPLIVLGEYGKGKVCYISPDITANYAFDNVANMRHLIAAVIKWLAPPRIEIVAPKCVLSSVFAQADRRIVHLVNYAASTKNVAEMGGLFGYFKNASPRIKEFFFTRNEFRQSTRPDIPDPDLAQLVQDWRHRQHVQPANPIDEVNPVFDLQVKVRGEVRRAYLAPGNEPLSVESENGCSVVKVPRVDIWAIVVVE